MALNALILARPPVPQDVDPNAEPVETPPEPDFELLQQVFQDMFGKKPTLTIEPDEIRVSTSHAYYSEKNPAETWPEIAAMGDWLAQSLPTYEVRYGSGSGDWDDMLPWATARLYYDEYWKAWHPEEQPEEVPT